MVVCKLAAKQDVNLVKMKVVAHAAGVDLKIEKAPPSGVPELTVGSSVVRYTGAILRCLGKMFENSSLYGTCFVETAQVDSWLDWTELEFGAGESPNTEAALERLEKHLETRTFLVGQRFSVADASLSCSLAQLSLSLPTNVKRWLDTCTASPSYAAAGGKVSASTGGGALSSGAAPAADAPALDDASLTCKYSSAVGGRVQIKKIIQAGEALIGRTIRVCGWVRTMRDQKQVMFLELTDGSCPQGLQVVLDPAVPGYESLKGKCGTGASVSCLGTLVKSPAPKQPVELLLKESDHEVTLFGGVDAQDYPMAKGKHSMEFLRSIGHLRPRSTIIGSVARVRNALAHATHEFFRSRDFVYVHTPLITAADCEGAGEMFQVTTLLADAEQKGLPMTADKKIDYSKDFFAKPSYLTVSGQLSVENYCCALSNVYTFGPTFRAENSHTSRHLAEFWMIEPELAFADIMDDMDCAEDYLKYCVKYAMTHNRADLEFFDRQVEKGLIARLENLLAEPFKRLTYTEAIDVLIKESKKAKFSVPVEWGMDLGSEHERYLAEKIYRKPVILYNYPKDIKAFYMRLNTDEKTVAAMDVLAPGIGEVIGGSQREERLDVLDRRITEMGLEPKDYWWYRDLRRYGTVPHSGFGLGFERLIMLTTGIENIRDVIPYPRYPGHAEF
mmetsp:Transcript_81012/g.177875  ORF Transcript_81012/g.177875 Transcript_81012/m.177875 type:complete len:672 (-) Transcript_81012:138-2153(-)